MKKTAVRFGIYGICTLLALFFISWMVFNQQPENYKTQEVVTWSGILLSVLFVYFGMKYYRDKQNDGLLSFGEGMKLGVLIVLFPAVVFGLYNVIHILWLDPQFLDRYYSYQVDQIKNTVAAAEIDAQLKEVQEMKETFASPLVQFIAMFLCVFVVGLIITIISILILKRKNAQPAPA